MVFSVVDIVKVLTTQADYQTARKYWNKLKERLLKEGNESVTNCHQLKLEARDGKKYLTDVANIDQPTEFAILTNIIHQEWSAISVNDHKISKGLKSENLRDHMSEAELIFTALAETMNAIGLEENKIAGKTGGNIAKNARTELENKTGKKVVTIDNNLPPKKNSKKLMDKSWVLNKPFTV